MKGKTRIQHSPGAGFAEASRSPRKSGTSGDIAQTQRRGRDSPDSLHAVFLFPAAPVIPGAKTLKNQPPAEPVRPEGIGDAYLAHQSESNPVCTSCAPHVHQPFRLHRIVYRNHRPSVLNRKSAE